MTLETAYIPASAPHIANIEMQLSRFEAHDTESHYAYDFRIAPSIPRTPRVLEMWNGLTKAIYKRLDGHEGIRVELSDCDYRADRYDNIYICYIDIPKSFEKEQYKNLEKALRSAIYFFTITIK